LVEERGAPATWALLSNGAMVAAEHVSVRP
jgi:hypothetical protein